MWAALRARPERVVRLFYAPTHGHALADVVRALAQRRVPFRGAGEEELVRIAGSRAHQGLVAVMEEPPIPVLTAESVRGWARAPGLALLLDGVENPHNLGALARTAAFLGVRDFAVVGPGAAALRSGAVYRTAEGAMESLAAWRVDAAEACIRAFGAAGGVTIALDVAGAADLGDVEGWAQRRPCLLVAGSEEHGVAPATLALCAPRVRIEGTEAVQSLNVAVATALALYALRGRGEPISAPGHT